MKRFIVLFVVWTGLVMSNSTYAQKKVITFALSFDKGWEILSDINQYRGKVIIIPQVDSTIHSFYLWKGKSPVDLILVDSSAKPDTYSKAQKKTGFLIKKFPTWIQLGYKNEQGTMIKSCNYRYARKY